MSICRGSTYIYRTTRITTAAQSAVPRAPVAWKISCPPVIATFTTSSRHRSDPPKSSIAKETERHNRELQQQTASNGDDANMSKMGYTDKMSEKSKKGPSIPRPSASVLLISPQNQVLLLQRVKQSSSFASAHVFPGGNISEFHDGRCPEPEHPDRHVDSDVYRMAAIRETFEESGIVLARNNGFGRLIEVPEKEREEGRRLVHGSEVPFSQWLSKHGGRADLEGLTPFTRWVTPTNVPKRFTTQMYLYFLPTLGGTKLAEGDDGKDGEEVDIPSPTTDGGKEHTTARFLPASAWLRLAQEGRIILFPPQFFLLHQVAQHLDTLKSPTDYGSISREAVPREELEARRKGLLEFVKQGSPPWTDMCISPTVLPARDGKKREDGRSVLGLSRPGPELEKQRPGPTGPTDQCVVIGFRKEGPRQVAVVSREDALAGGAKL